MAVLADPRSQIVARSLSHVSNSRLPVITLKLSLIFQRIRRILMLVEMLMMYRKRKMGRGRDIKAVSVEALHAQAAFYHHFKTSSPTRDSTLPPGDSLPVQLNADAPASGPCKLVLRGGGAETPGLGHCPVCYDVLVPATTGTGNRQLRDNVTSGNDVTKRRPVTAAARADAGRCLVTNSRRNVNGFNSMYSV